LVANAALLGRRKNCGEGDEIVFQIFTTIIEIHDVTGIAV
jgi:hypothetical protein